MWQGALLLVTVIPSESGMIMQQAQIANKIASGETGKRWTAPEVTRLDFPKTAGGGGHIGIELPNSYVSTS